MLVFAILTLFGSGAGQMPALATVRSRAYLSNFLIGGSVGGTLTGLYASRNRRHREELERQANRLEVLNRLLRHEVLNALTVIRGYAAGVADAEADAVEIIQRRVDDIEKTIDDVKHLTRSARREADATASVDLIEQLTASIASRKAEHADADITLEPDSTEVAVRADRRLELLFDRLFERVLARGPGPPPDIEVSVSAGETEARIDITVHGDEVLADAERALLETGEIPTYDDPGSGFDLSIVRLLVERYRGRIEAGANGTFTTITIVLPRADLGDGNQRPLPAGIAGIRPALPHSLVVFGAAIIAGVFYAWGSELFGGSVAGIGVFYGTASPLVGWITHQFHSVVFAFAYAGWVSLLPAEYRDHVPAYVAVGVVWALVLWLGAAGIVAPVWLQLLGIQASIPNLSFNLLVAHLSWGPSLGVLTALGYRHVVPWLAGVSLWAGRAPEL